MTDDAYLAELRSELKVVADTIAQWTESEQAQWAVDKGVLRACLSQEAGLGLSTSAAVEAFACLGCAGVSPAVLFRLGAQAWAVQAPIERFGTPGQRERLAMLSRRPGSCAFALSEPMAGSDALALITTARATGDGWCLNGEKAWITNGSTAELVLVVARTRESAGMPAFGLTAFLLDVGSPGVEVLEPTNTNLADPSLRTIRFHDCILPAEAVLGHVGGGFRVVAYAMELERAFILSGTLGTVRRLIAQSGRTETGASGPAIRWVELAAACQMVEIHLAQVSAIGPTAASSSVIKLLISELSTAVSAKLMPLGSMMYPDDPWRNVLLPFQASQIYSGTSNLQRDIIARELGLP